MLGGEAWSHCRFACHIAAMPTDPCKDQQSLLSQNDSQDVAITSPKFFALPYMQPLTSLEGLFDTSRSSACAARACKVQSNSRLTSLMYACRASGSLIGLPSSSTRTPQLAVSSFKPKKDARASATFVAFRPANAIYLDLTKSSEFLINALAQEVFPWRF